MYLESMARIRIWTCRGNVSGHAMDTYPDMHGADTYLESMVRIRIWKASHGYVSGKHGTDTYLDMPQKRIWTCNGYVSGHAADTYLDMHAADTYLESMVRIRIWNAWRGH